jgi:flagellar hook protein FlgE
MGIFGAMETAVSGMQAQAYALNNISGNIANSQTIGYKRIDTNFQDLIPDLGSSSQITGGVNAASLATNSVAGAFKSTGINSNIALSGDGYFTVSRQTASASGALSFENTPYFSRRGDFSLDKNKYLVNGAGYYLMGYKVDPISGMASSGTPTTIQLPTGDMAPKATSTITYQGNLPTTPSNPTSTGVVLAPATAASSGPPAVAATTVSANNESGFLNSTITGGTVTAYDTKGSPVTLQTRWAKNTSGTWDLYYQNNSSATGSAAKWTFLQNFQFDSSGALASPASPYTITTPTSFAIDGTTLGALTVNFSGMSQYGDTSGQFRTTNVAQDGYSSASLTGVQFGNLGRIYATYSNGMQQPVADISVAKFNGGQALKRLDGGVYKESDQSGVPIYGAGDSNIMVGGLEASNADISQEFSAMIATQQAYSANAKVITAAQQMMTEAVNVIR